MTFSVFAAILFASSASTLPRVGVVCFGSNPPDVAHLQEVVQAQLRQDLEVVVVSPETQGTILDSRASVLMPASGRVLIVQRESDRILGDVKTAYYEDRLAYAMDQLGDLRARQQAIEGYPLQARVRVFLWRAAVYLELGDQDQARRELRLALALNLEPEVDLREFRPSLLKLLNRVKTEEIQTVQVQLKGTPVGAKVWVDERPVGGRFQVSAGEHQLLVKAPGYQDYKRELSFHEDQVVAARLALSLKPTVQELFASVVWENKVGKKAAELVDEIRRQSGLAALVLVGLQWSPSARARSVLVLGSGRSDIVASDIIPWGAGKEVEVSAWVAERLRNYFQPVAAKKGVRNQERLLARRHAASSLQLSLDAGGVGTVRRRVISGFSHGADFDVQFVGAGPSLQLSVRRGRLQGGLVGDWVQYDFSRPTLIQPDGQEVRLRGGDTFRGRFEFGLRTWDWLELSAVKPVVVLGLGARWEQHKAVSLGDDSGDSGLFSSYTYWGPFVWVQMGWPLHLGRHRFDFQLGGSWLPWSEWRHQPQSRYGKESGAPLGYGWSTGIGYDTGDSWRLGFVLASTQLQGSYSGSASVNLEPELSNAKLLEDSTTALFSFGWLY